jgi:hypothetical protein
MADCLWCLDGDKQSPSRRPAGILNADVAPQTQNPQYEYDGPIRSFLLTLPPSEKTAFAGCYQSGKFGAYAANA